MAEKPTYQQLANAMTELVNMGRIEDAKRVKEAIEQGNYKEESSMAASALQGIGQGATFGFADELGAGARAAIFDPLVSSLAGGDIGGVQGFKDYFTGMGERYDLALGSQREALETARREDPWTTGIGEVVGGLGSGGIGAGAKIAGAGLRMGGREALEAAARPTLGQAMRRGAGYGVPMGGVAGYGYSEADPLRELARQAAKPGDMSTEDWNRVKQELGQAGFEAGMGAGMGGAIGGAFPLAAAGLRGVARLVARPFNKEARLTEEARRSVLARLESDIENGHITWDEAKRRLADTPEMSIMDLSPGLQKMAEEIAQSPTAAAGQIESLLQKRNREQWRRIMPNLARALGRDEDNFAVARRELIEDMHTRGQALYDEAHAVQMRLTKPMRDIIMNPAFRNILNKANKLKMAELRQPLKRQGGVFQSSKDMDYILRGFDDHVNALYRAGDSQLATAAKNQRNALREMMYKQNPALKKARNTWAGDKANDDAMDMGLRIFRDDADIVQELMRDMSESEINHFKIGVLRAVTRRLGNKSDTADLTKGLFDRPNAREALRVAFGSTKKFEEFMEMIGREQQMFNTYHLATGNSRTASRLMNSVGDQLGKVAALIGYTGALATGTGVPPSIGGYVAQKAFERLSPMGRRLARERIMRGGQAQNLMGNDLRALQQGPGGLLSPGMSPSVGGLLGATLATGLPQQNVDYGVR